MARTTSAQAGIFAVAIAFTAFCLAVAAPAQTFTTVVNFQGGGDGIGPSGLMQGTDGALYGTTYAGGNGRGFYGDEQGTAFTITPQGATTVWDFCSFPNCSDGAGPLASPVEMNGIFYGTAELTGSVYAFIPYICCVSHPPIWNCTTFWCETQLYSFAWNPYISSPLFATAGDNLYGTTIDGGAPGCGAANQGCGTVFKLNVNHMAPTIEWIYTFCSQPNCADGQYPYAGVVQATDNNLYGVTGAGGANGNGTVFKITTGGSLTTLYTFTNSDGANGNGSLLQASDGNLYGVTATGGVNGGGTIFRISTTGKFTRLYSFCALPNCADGSSPIQALVQGSDGNLYGTTLYGGGSTNCFQGCGTVFQITLAGVLTTLHAFSGSDGESPFVLLQSTDGSFYGTAGGGGTYGSGTVFNLSLGLAPFVKTQPVFGKAGTPVTILGPMGAATGVSFNGTAATFTVLSNTEIATTVPVAATTGAVEVSTAIGTLSSNVPFQVASPSSTTLASSLSSSTYGQGVTWTASVAPTGPRTPTGSVNFTWTLGGETYTIGSATLNSSGVATLTRSNLNADMYPINAGYMGDLNNAGSTSPVLDQTVQQATSSATLTATPNPSTVGEAVTFTAEVTSPTVVPTGPVTFTAGKTTLGSVELSKGKATFTTSSLPAGANTITVTYPWNSDIAGSSASVIQTVEQ